MAFHTSYQMDAPMIQKQFTETYEREADALFRYCFMRVHDREKAIDIVQDIFSELWKKYQSGEKIEYQRAYLFTLAHNRIIDWYRKKKSDSLDALLENGADGKAFEPADEKMHSDIILSSEAKFVIEAIKKLEPIYRDVLSLRFTEDLTPAEIGDIIRENPNTVSVRINRGLEKLKEQFHTKQ